ncbi:MAG: FtsX-like permease family protein [Myxococcota bacterium]
MSAAMVGLRSKMGLFRMRAWINNFADEPLMAVMPARAFQRLWSTVGVAEKALRVIGVLVSLAGIIALVATLLATVQARRREMALLRSVGASPLHIAVLIVGEALIVALASATVALVGVYLLGTLGRSTLAGYGLRLTQLPVTGYELLWVAAFLATATLVSLIPAMVTYRRSLSDGLLVRT